MVLCSEDTSWFARRQHEAKKGCCPLFGPGEDPADFTTTYTYDDRTDQIATITDPNGRQERREYNGFGDLTKLSDETGYIYSEWVYDTAGRVIKEGTAAEGYFLYVTAHLKLTPQ